MHDHSTKILDPHWFILSLVKDHLTKIWGHYWFMSFISTRPFDNIIRRSFIYFFFDHDHSTKIRVLINLISYLYTTILPNLEVTLTLWFMLFLIVLIFCWLYFWQYCFYILFAIYKAVLATLIFCTLYSWKWCSYTFGTLYPQLYEVFPNKSGFVRPETWTQNSDSTTLNSGKQSTQM